MKVLNFLAETEKRKDFLRNARIFRKEFSEKNYDFPKKSYDFPRKAMIFRKKTMIFRKKTMIFRETIFSENHSFSRKIIVFFGKS